MIQKIGEVKVAQSGETKTGENSTIFQQPITNKQTIINYFYKISVSLNKTLL